MCSPISISGSEGKMDLPYCDKLELMKEFLTRQVDKEEVEEKLGECSACVYFAVSVHVCIFASA